MRSVEFLASRGVLLVDCQVRTDHLVSLGAHEISRNEFLARLREVLDLPTGRGPWDIESPARPARA